MMGLAIELLLEHLDAAGLVLDALVIGDIARRSARWLWPRCRTRLEQADDDLRRRLESWGGV